MEMTNLLFSHLLAVISQVMMQKVALFGAKIGREDHSSRSLFLATFP